MPRVQGRGLGTEATRLIVGHGFERLGLHRISLEVCAFNPRARRLYEKVGFLPEGERVDAAVMSILAPEWSQHRGWPETTGNMSAGPCRSCPTTKPAPAGD